jgi:hypothetical protein
MLVTIVAVAFHWSCTRTHKVLQPLKLGEKGSFKANNVRIWHDELFMLFSYYSKNNGC